MLAPKRLLTALALTLIGSTTAQAADEVVVYSSRIDELIKPVFDAYTAKTGVQVKFITDKEAPLMQRIKAEGENATADLLLTVDAGNLWQAEQMGILQPFTSKTIDANIPLQYRSSSHAWTGLSLRARTIAYSTDRVKPGELTTYEASGRQELGRSPVPAHGEEGLQPVPDRHHDRSPRRRENREDPQGLGQQPVHRRVLR